MSKFAEVKEKWANASDLLKHIDIKSHLVSVDNLQKNYEVEVIRDNDFSNKSVIDFGIGGGYLGELLFRKYGIKKYIGYDIDDKSIEVSRERLKDYNAEFVCIEEKYKIRKANWFISLACIQHFIDIEMLDHFLKSVNNSKCDNLILQFRHSDKTEFSGSYITEDDVVYSCKTNINYVKEKLNKYELVYQCQLHNRSKYFYSQFRLI